MRPVDERVRLGDPELFHCVPVTNNDGSLVAENALEDAGLQLLRPFCEDRGVILAVAASKFLKVTDEGGCRGDLGDTGDAREVGLVSFCLLR